MVDSQTLGLSDPRLFPRFTKAYLILHSRDSRSAFWILLHLVYVCYDISMLVGSSTIEDYYK